MPSPISKINRRKVDEGNAIERAVIRGARIVKALASTAGKGDAGVAEGDAAKGALSDGGGPKQG
jgi:hypothetical protein